MLQFFLRLFSHCMTNAQHSHKHGMTMANVLRPKSSGSKRRNKAKASIRKSERRALKTQLLGR